MKRSSNNNDVKTLKGKNDIVLLKEELNRVKLDLQHVTKKNQDLEEMLLYTTKELQKEKENSRGIVVTLTNRLMESRETINKLEIENIRLKKDCILAAELLQCNKIIDKEKIATTVEKLSGFASKPVDGRQRSSTYPKETEVKNQPNSKIAQETTLKGKSVVQQPKSFETLKGKSKTCNKRNDNIALLQENAHENEAKQLASKEGITVRENVPSVQNDRLSRLDNKGYVKVEDDTSKEKSFIEKLHDKSSSKRKGDKNPGRHEGVPLMDEKLSMSGNGIEDNLVKSVEEDKKVSKGDEELLKEAERYIKKDSQEVEHRTLLTKGSPRASKEKIPLITDCLDDISQAKPQSQGEKPNNSVGVHGTQTTENSWSYQEYKGTINDGIQMVENETFLQDENIIGRHEAPLDKPASEVIQLVRDEESCDRDNQSLASDDAMVLADTKPKKGSMEESNSLTAQVVDNSLTEVIVSPDDDDIRKDKETEEESLVAENTPLV